MSVLELIFGLLIFPGFLFTVIAGLMLSWLDRKLTARLQWRVGPPWYQPWADLFKLFGKEMFVPQGSATAVFLLAPLLGTVVMTIIAVMIWSMNFYPRLGFVGDLIVLVYLFALPTIGVFLAGTASRNPLASVGASREMMMYFGYEIPFLIAVAVIIVKAGGAIKLGEIIMAQHCTKPFMYSFSGAVTALVLIMVIAAKLSIVPFDAAEAEQEIMAGPLIEYSGIGLAFFRLTRAMMLFVLPLFFISFLWGGFASWWALPKFLVIFVLLVLIKNTNPRLRIDQALRFFWSTVSGLAVIGLVLALLGL